jgi:hypothetical protein
VRVAYKVNNHQTNQNHDEKKRDKEDDSLNHAIQIIEKLLQEAR